jgi:hypothetical protein
MPKFACTKSYASNIGLNNAEIIVQDWGQAQVLIYKSLKALLLPNFGYTKSYVSGFAQILA